ncbi:MAG: mechanosensitive ion channel family protein [Bacilli bacterium]|nr:mechanosensitive ion channel family protein [Bacilli bacterium]
MPSKNDLKKSRINLLIKNIISIGLLTAGVLVLCGFLAIIQNVNAERSQRRSSQRILDEVAATLRDDDNAVNSIFEEFNQINQTTLDSLSLYVNYIDILAPLKNSESMTPEQVEQEISTVTDELSEICENISVNEIFIVHQNGDILLGSNSEYLGMNISSVGAHDALIGYEKNANGDVIRNGTCYFDENGNPSYAPVTLETVEATVYLYSSFFGTLGDDSYYVLTYVPSSVIDTELAGLKSIDNVLSGITVGKSGFLFAVDTNEGIFKYFNDGQDVLTGDKYSEYGLSDEAAINDYSGYQKINNVRYYLVAMEFKSETYGQFTVVAAVVSQQEILMKNVLTILFSCAAFIMVAAIVASYGLILKRDIANHILSLEEKHRSNLLQDTRGGVVKFTDEEIDERTKIMIDEDIEGGNDKKLSRVNLGVRNAKGVQRYFSKYTFIKMSAVIAVGLIAIFVISFFSQTLLGLNDATSVSQRRLDEITLTLEKNSNNAETIQQYVDEQFLSKARLISYMLEETPEVLSLNVNDKNIHRVLDKDENGDNIELDHTDYPGSPRYAISNSQVLQEICDNNALRSVYIYADDGRVMATNTPYWYFRLSKDPADQSYPFNQILEDKVDYYVQESMVNEVDGSTEKYIGTEFFYYTYLDGSDVRLARESEYKAYLDGSMAKGVIRRHRSLIQIEVDEFAIGGLFNTTTMDYVLSNMHVYGDSSFFITFDNSSDHIVTYSPFSAMIGKSAASIGISENVFMMDGTYNGFQKINGVRYYQTVKLMGDYYIATAIPTNSIYESRNAISWYTLLFSAISIVAASSIFTISSDKADKTYCKAIKYKNHGNSDARDTFVLNTASGKKTRTKSAAARFSRVVWAKKTPEEKISSVLIAYLTVASIAILALLIYAFNNKDTDNIFSYIFSGVWERGFNIFAITASIMIMIVLVTVTKLVHICVRSFCGTLGARVETTGNLVVSVLKYGGVIGGVFYCLYLFGFNTGSLLTSAGILSIVIGLGAQSLISDIIAGIFIVFEGSFRVGDIVTIGDFRGQVLEIGLRTTKIEDPAMNIKIFNNSAISGVINMTKEASYAAIDVSIEYGEDIERVEKVLKNAFPMIRRKLPSITDGPFYKGVAELGDSAVILRITAQCTEKDRLQLARDLNREIFILFGKNNINIPFPQVTMSYLDQPGADDEKEPKKDGK